MIVKFSADSVNDTLFDLLRVIESAGFANNFITFAFCKLLLCHDRMKMSPVLMLLSISLIN